MTLPDAGYSDPPTGRDAHAWFDWMSNHPSLPEAVDTAWTAMLIDPTLRDALLCRAVGLYEYKYPPARPRRFPSYNREAS